MRLGYTPICPAFLPPSAPTVDVNATTSLALFLLYLSHSRRSGGEEPLAYITISKNTAARYHNIPRPMSATDLPGGKVHDLPDDLATALTAHETAEDAWLDITELARNEFICWVTSAKQRATRERRIGRTVEELVEGKRRPCCWPGCPHRERDGK